MRDQFGEKVLKRRPSLIIVVSSMALLVVCYQNILSASQNFYAANHPNIRYVGRIDFTEPQKPKLSGAGAYFQVKFKGRSCALLLEDQGLWGNHGYLAVELDGQYLGRIKVTNTQTEYTVVQDISAGEHSLLVCKATESQTGYIALAGIRCEALLPITDKLQHKIEFIGNSITCGMGLDTETVSCDSGTWYDQHNAYLAYGPQVARALNADWLLSSVSGIGICRNWNSPGPTMPDVYQNLYLNKDSSFAWNDSTFIPDLISICLGTNDFSDGDGSYQRAELDSATFVNSYIQFIQMIRKRYPKARICCLSSPAIAPEKGRKLCSYLTAIAQHFHDSMNNDKIHLFFFSRPYGKGCTGHPDRKEHQMMAEELLPFYRQVVGW